MQEMRWPLAQSAGLTVALPSPATSPAATLPKVHYIANFDLAVLFPLLVQGKERWPGQYSLWEMTWAQPQVLGSRWPAVGSSMCTSSPTSQRVSMATVELTRLKGKMHSLVYGYGVEVACVISAPHLHLFRL